MKRQPNGRLQSPIRGTRAQQQQQSPRSRRRRWPHHVPWNQSPHCRPCRGDMRRTSSHSRLCQRRLCQRRLCQRRLCQRRLCQRRLCLRPRPMPRPARPAHIAPQPRCPLQQEEEEEEQQEQEQEQEQQQQQQQRRRRRRPPARPLALRPPGLITRRRGHRCW